MCFSHGIFMQYADYMKKYGDNPGGFWSELICWQVTVLGEKRNSDPENYMDQGFVRLGCVKSEQHGRLEV